MNDMVNEVKLKVGAVCIGNAGGQAGLNLYKHGIDVMLINTSARDLANEVIPSAVKSFIILDSDDNGRGAGRNREIAKKLYDEWDQSKELLNREDFNTFVRSKDVIFVMGSTGGGTGSGIVPKFAFQLTRKFPNKVIIVIGIMPRLNESINSQINNVKFWDEIDSLNKMGVNIPYMAFDLEKTSHLKIDESYHQIAEDINSAIQVISGAMSSITPYGMIDERNMLTMITTGGLMSVYSNEKVKMTDIAEKGIQQIIKDQMKLSSNVQIQRDKICKYYGLFIEVDEGLDDPTKQADYNTLFEICGEPFEIFVNYGITDKPVGKYGLIISGQSMPYDRIKSSVERAKEYERNLKEKEYSMSEDAMSIKLIGGKTDIGKILGSSSETPAEVNDDIPDFLKSDL